jgi:hypothetical protein
MSFRGSLLTCVCLSALLGCGHPIRELANAAKDLIPESDAKNTGCVAAPTSRIELIANLDARSALGLSWDAERPDASAAFSLGSSAYAGDERAVELQIFFARTGEHAWEWHVLAGEPAIERGNGELVFDADGGLLEERAALLLRLPRADGSLGAPIVLWFGTPKSEDADGFDGVTSTREPSQLTGYEQDRHSGAPAACAEDSRR